MSVETVTERLAILQMLIPAPATAKIAFAKPPNVLNSTDMPLWLNLPAETEYDDDALGQEDYLDTRTYNMILVVGQIGQDRKTGDLIARCWPFLVAVKPFFKARPSLSYYPTYSGLQGVQRTFMRSDGGVTQVQWNGEQFIGVQFPLVVEEVVPYVYAVGE